MILRAGLVGGLLTLAGCNSMYFSKQPENTCGLRNAERDALLNPETNYKKMLSCLKAKNPSRALDYFALAGISTWYDAQVRTSDMAGERHKILLQNSLAMLDSSAKEQVWDDFSTMMRNKKQLESVCKYTKAVGEYRKRSQVFDDLAWEQAEEGYLHCSFQ